MSKFKVTGGEAVGYDAAGAEVALSTSAAVLDGATVRIRVAVETPKAPVTMLHDRVKRRSAISDSRLMFTGP